MSLADDRVLVVAAVRRSYAAVGLSWPPIAGAPIPLDRLIGGFNLIHEEVPGLTRAVAAAQLARRCDVVRPELMGDETPLAGFLFANAAGGYILVRREDILPRRRFSAAHELGHYLLHFLEPARPADADAYLVQDDAAETIQEEDEPALPLPEMERQANLFAAELLMPEEVCRQLVERYVKQFGRSERFVEHHLAGDLLVSREAARWRMRSLGLLEW